jgi:hypothetical protein
MLAILPGQSAYLRRRHGFPPGINAQGGKPVSAENRLTADQLAALVPGDVVTIESGAEFGRRRYVNGTVARSTDRHVVVRVGSYVECYRLRDGVRDGGAGYAELVDDAPRAGDEAQRRARQLDQLYRDWTRHRGDLDRLQQLHAAIGKLLEESTASVR